jgi:hypothetical protein
MNRVVTIFMISILLNALSARAESDIDAAIQRLQADLDKMHADIASEADKQTLLADKQKIKSDKAALQAARRAAKSDLLQGRTSGDSY